MTELELVFERIDTFYDVMAERASRIASDRRGRRKAMDVVMGAAIIACARVLCELFAENPVAARCRLHELIERTRADK